MPLEKGFIDRDRFYAGHLGSSFKAENAVDHQKRESMGQDFHYLIRIESSIADWPCPWCRERKPACALSRQRSGEIGIGAMPGFDCDNVSADPLTHQCQISDDIENFVPNEFVREAQRFLAENSVASNDNRILQTAASDQVFVHQWLNILVIDEGAGRSDFALEYRRSNLE